MKKRRAESREGMVITTVALPRDLHRRLAIAALEERAAIAELIRDSVTQYLAERDRKGRKGKRP
jgi:nitrate/nitrite-specific signal transduction histidine kinase